MGSHCLGSSVELRENTIGGLIEKECVETPTVTWIIILMQSALPYDVPYTIICRAMIRINTHTH